MVRPSHRSNDRHPMPVCNVHTQCKQLLGTFLVATVSRNVILSTINKTSRQTTHFSSATRWSASSFMRRDASRSSARRRSCSRFRSVRSRRTYNTAPRHVPGFSSSKLTFSTNCLQLFCQQIDRWTGQGWGRPCHLDGWNGEIV